MSKSLLYLAINGWFVQPLVPHPLKQICRGCKRSPGVLFDVCSGAYKYWGKVAPLFSIFALFAVLPSIPKPLPPKTTTAYFIFPANIRLYFQVSTAVTTIYVSIYRSASGKSLFVPVQSQTNPLPRIFRFKNIVLARASFPDLCTRKNKRTPIRIGCGNLSSDLQSAPMYSRVAKALLEKKSTVHFAVGTVDLHDNEFPLRDGGSALPEGRLLLSFRKDNYCKWLSWKQCSCRKL